MQYSGLFHKTVNSFIWNFLEKASGQIISLIVQIVLARLLSPSDFGVMAIMLVFINIGNVFVQSGLDTAIIQAEKLDSLDLNCAFWMSFSLSVALYFLLFISAPAISSYYRMPELRYTLRVLGLVLPFNSMYSIQNAQVTRALDFKRIFIATLIATISSGTLGVASVYFGCGIWGLVIQQVSFSCVAAMTLTFETRWLPSFEFSLERASRIFRFSSKLLLSGILGTLYQSLSDLIIGKQFSSTSLGYFNQGKKYPQTLGSTLNATIQPIMLSVVSKVQNDTAQVKYTVRTSLKTSVFIVMPVMIYCACAARPIVSFLLGDQWLPCVPFFQAFCFYYALLPVHNANLQALNGIGRSDIYLRLEVVQDGIGVFILLLTTFLFKNIHAIAFGYCICSVLSVFITAFPNRITIGYSYCEQFIDIVPTLVISVLAALPSLYLNSVLTFNPFVLIVITFFLTTVLYFIFARFLKLEPLELVLSLLRSKK